MKFVKFTITNAKGISNTHEFPEHEADAFIERMCVLRIPVKIISVSK